MKRLIFLFLMIIGFAFISCNKEAEPVNEAVYPYFKSETFTKQGASSAPAALT